MSASLDKKRTQVEYSRVQAARYELEFRIEEHLENISRLEEQLKIQKAKEDELKAKLDNM